MAVFRLGRLLRLYVQDEEHCKRAYQQAEARRLQVASLLESLWTELANTACQRGVIHGQQLQQLSSYRYLLTERITTARDDLNGAELVVEEARKRMLAARQRREMLERLREKYDARQHSALMRMEQSLLDEAGLHTYAKQDA